MVRTLRESQNLNYLSTNTGKAPEDCQSTVKEVLLFSSKP